MDKEELCKTTDEEKKISVIIPCHNAELTIDRCMESVEKQTIGVENLEIILVNDASKDKTLEKLCIWEAKYPNSIIVIDCEENKKPGGARNIGLDYAGGQYIAFADADDILEEDMYEMLFEAADKQCDVAICGSSREIA